MRYRFLRFPDGKPKAATFSYDDGCRADIKLSNIFDSYGIKATFNLSSNRFGKNAEDWHLTVDEVREHIILKGHEIAVHGADHKANGNIRPVEGILDVSKCRVDLEEEFDTIIRGMAYPDTGILRFINGITYDDVKSYLKALDIAYARTLGGKNDTFNLPNDWHQWLPTAHHDHPEIFDLVDKFVKFKIADVGLANRVPKLLYIWGHSFEFDRNNNWDRIEKICEKVSNNEDIWYATNIEIYEYVEAYHSLVFSADSCRIYNPTVKQIWFEVDDVSYTIKPGETIKIQSN